MTSTAPVSGEREYNIYADVASEYGKRSGHTRAINRVERYVEDLVSRAPELSPERAERLRGILAGALEKLEASA